MAHAVRTAISLPLEDYRRMEFLRKKLEKSRSEVFREAIRAWFRHMQTAELERRHVDGYRRKPEEPAEMDALLKAGLAGMARERW